MYAPSHDNLWPQHNEIVAHVWFDCNRDPRGDAIVALEVSMF